MMEDIVLITNDSWRHDTLSSMVHLRNATDSFTVLDAITQGGSTKAALPPILSSIYWKEEDAPSSSEPRSLPSVLAENGYTTAAFIGTNPFASRWESDFDGFWNGGGQAHNKYIRNIRRGIDFMLLRKETPAHQVLKRAKQWYTSTSSPRFMWVHLMDTHEPYYPSLRKGVSNGLVNTYKTLYEQKLKNRQEDFDIKSQPSQFKNTLERLYRDSVVNIDSKIAEFVDSINEDATVILTGDHGEAFNHGFRKHLQVYDELTRVPFLVRWTLEEEFGFSEEVFHLDIAPALASALNLPIPDGWRGKPKQPAEERISLMFNRDTRINRLYVGCRTSRYKYIQNYSCSSVELLSEELYDIREDPHETNNIFDGSHDFVSECRQRIETYFEETGHSPASLAGASQTADGDDVSEELKEKLSHLGYR